MNPDASERLAAALAATKDRLARIYTVWSLQGPTLEACTALTAMAQEEAGHARALMGIAGDQHAEFGLACLDDIPTTWPGLVGSVGLVELAVVGVVRVVRNGGNAILSARTAKMAVEEAFHEDLFRGWFPLLVSEAAPVVERFRSALAAAHPQLEKWLTGLDELAVEAGVARPGELLAAALPPPVGALLGETTRPALEVR